MTRSYHLSALLLAVSLSACALRETRALDATARARCPADDGPSAFPPGENDEGWRRTWLRFAQRSWPSRDAACGMEVLAMFGDLRVVPALRAALRKVRDAPPLAAVSLIRIAGTLTSYPQPDAGVALAPLVDELTHQLANPETKAFAYGSLGRIDHASAVALLQRELNVEDDERRGLAIRALGVQGHVDSLATVRRLVGDPQWQTAERRTDLAMFLLTADSSSVPEGLALFDQIPRVIAPRIARIAVQVICERGIWRPADKARALAHRQILEAGFDQRGVAWRAIVVNSSPSCQVAPK